MPSDSPSTRSIVFTQPAEPSHAELLTPLAVAFLAELHRVFEPTRRAILQRRVLRQHVIDGGENPDFLPGTASIRNDVSWQVDAVPNDLQNRWVEITGPTDKKMLINALNSGADIFMADFEDANAPTWENMVEGQLNLIDAVKGSLSFSSSEGKHYQVNPERAVLMVRPRGWHLSEKHLLIDGEPISGSLFDFGLYFFHNAQTLLSNGSGPYFYLAKMQGHLEARLWNDVFIFAQKYLGIALGTIKATVLIETLLAAFEMDEILFELRHHSAGLNAGRWDYIFSIIKTLKSRESLVLPDRIQITMTVPFMRAYTELLVQTCHKRGAHAMGGMAAFVPSRKDKEVNAIALAKVREDKLRETHDGFDGTWVAHPDLVSTAHAIFAEALNQKSHQKERKREEVHVTATDLLNFDVPGGTITEDGVRRNITIALQYINSWLSGVGAIGLFNLMEDVATAEISRAQLWQWIHHGPAKLTNGQVLTPLLYQAMADEETERIKDAHQNREGGIRYLAAARKLLDDLVLSTNFAEFLTLNAYHQL